MKHLYLWLLAIVIGVGILPASAQEAANIKFTVNIPNPEAVKCQVKSIDYPLVQGANHFEVEPYTSISFNSVAPWRISNIANSKGTSVSGLYNGTWYFYPSTGDQDEVYTFSLINLNEYRTSEFTINVDDPDLVNAYVEGYDTSLTLKKGSNVIKYDPAVEKFITFSPVNYSVPLYSLTVNDTPVVRQGSGFRAQIEEDCVMDLVAKLPEQDCTVTFTYAEGAKGSINVQVAGVNVEDFNGESIAVKMGNSLNIIGNTQLYNYAEVTVNGTPVSFYGSYSFNVMEDSEVYIDAHPYGNIKATVIVGNPEFLSLSRGYGGDPIELQAGSNEIELPENNSMISWTVSDLAILNGIKLNGQPLNTYGASYYTLKEGDTMEFDIEEKVFDQEAVVWIDNVKGAACSLYLQMLSPSDRSWKMTFENGYNLLDYYNGMNPFTLSWFGQSEDVPNIHLTGEVYLNGERLKPDYENSTSHTITLANHDVLKLFMDGAPTECKVDFTIAEGVECEVVKDIFTAVENPSEGFDCFAGTEVSISGTGIKVTVNDTAVETDEKGAFTFTVQNEATKVEVASETGLGISSIASETELTVYNLQGIKIDNKSLTPGIYVINGKKVAVRK